MMKKLIAICLALAAVLTLLAACTPKTKTHTDADFTYEVQDDNTAKITGYTKTEDIVTLEIPNTIGDLTVTAIGEGAFEGLQNLTVVYVPDTLQMLGDRAFAKSSVKKVFLHKARGLKAIPSECFAECPNLVQVDMSNGVEILAPKAFSVCGNLRFITFRSDPGVIDPLAIDACPKVQLRVRGAYTNIIEYARKYEIKYTITDAAETTAAAEAQS